MAEEDKNFVVLRKQDLIPIGERERKAWNKEVEEFKKCGEECLRTNLQNAHSKHRLSSKTQYQGMDGMIPKNTLVRTNVTELPIHAYVDPPESVFKVIHKNQMPILFEKEQNVLHENEVSLPKNWDWREQTGFDGKSLLLESRHQGTCGSCYSYAAAMMLAHRISIKTNGKIRQYFSPQDVINCGNMFVENFLNDYKDAVQVRELINQNIIVEANWYVMQGCSGGLLASVCNYLVLWGLPTEEQVPYLHYDLDKYPQNLKTSKRADYCTYRQNNLPKYFAEKARSLVVGLEGSFPSERVIMHPDVLKFNNDNIMKAIYQHGPVIAGINIYSDFYYYPQLGDVYQRKKTIVVDDQEKIVKFEGAHAILIVGWGEKYDTEGNLLRYWICQNTWGINWGLKDKFGNGGYFLIERGINMCNIEYDVMSVLPNLEQSPKLRINAMYQLTPEQEQQSKIVFWILLAITIIVLVAAVFAVIAALRYNYYLRQKFRTSL